MYDVVGVAQAILGGVEPGNIYIVHACTFFDRSDRMTVSTVVVSVVFRRVAKTFTVKTKSCHTVNMFFHLEIQTLLE